MSFQQSDLGINGFETLPRVIAPSTVNALIRAVEAARAGEARREKNSRVYAIRNLIELVPEVGELAESLEIRAVVESVLGSGARVVRSLLFDKTPEANWKVAWHQDLSIAVERRIEVSGFGPWSMKAGVQHVQPPAEVLERMLTVRIHLDDCGPENGPLRVLPGSHAEGVLSPEQIVDWRRRVESVACCVPAGGAALMRPLILHASSCASVLGHRRVIHLEFADGELPGGLVFRRT